jgi:hypothetical protein
MIAVAVLAAACTKGGAPSIQLGESVVLSAPTSVGTAPMVAVGPGNIQAVAWVSAPNGGTDGRLYVSVHGAPPAEIRDSLGPVQAHGEAPPKIAFGPSGALYAVYTVGKEVAGERFPLSALRIVTSADNGKSWTSPVTVTDGEPWGSHSFHALHVAPNGDVYVSWLGKPDHDATMAANASMPAMKMASMQQGAADPHAAHGASTSWITRSTDGGKTWSARARVDMGEACPCCRTSLATGADGSLFMAWRHIYPGSVRDVVVARSDDRGATWGEPVRVHEDDWKFDACPHAGPAIATDARGTLHVTWWTGKEGDAGVFYTQSTDGGKTFSQPIALGTAQYSRPAHVQLSLADSSRVIVVWDDGTKQTPRVVARVSNDGGLHFADAVTFSDPGRAASFPVLAVTHDSISVAWSEESAAVAQQAAAEANNTKDPKAPKGLEAVGRAQVLVRHGVLR